MPVILAANIILCMAILIIGTALALIVYGDGGLDFEFETKLTAALFLIVLPALALAFPLLYIFG